MTTVEAFLQASGCPVHTKNLWLTVKKAIQELSTTTTTAPSTTQDEILRIVSGIEMKLSAHTAVQAGPLSYADQACLALLPNICEKHVPSRVLKEMTLKVIDEPKPNQTSEWLIESINAAHSSKADKVLAA
jgi:hypothetical protein